MTKSSARIYEIDSLSILEESEQSKESQCRSTHITASLVNFRVSKVFRHKNLICLRFLGRGEVFDGMMRTRHLR